MASAATPRYSLLFVVMSLLSLPALGLRRSARGSTAGF
jgi:hypothetical protein